MNQYANDFTSTVRIYYDDLKKYKPLTKAKEKRLLKLSRKGNLTLDSITSYSEQFFTSKTVPHSTQDSFYSSIMPLWPMVQKKQPGILLGNLGHILRI